MSSAIRPALAGGFVWPKRRPAIHGALAGGFVLSKMPASRHPVPAGGFVLANAFLATRGRSSVGSFCQNGSRPPHPRGRRRITTPWMPSTTMDAHFRRRTSMRDHGQAWSRNDAVATSIFLPQCRRVGFDWRSPRFRGGERNPPAAPSALGRRLRRRRRTNRSLLRRPRRSSPSWSTPRRRKTRVARACWRKRRCPAWKTPRAHPVPRGHS